MKFAKLSATVAAVAFMGSAALANPQVVTGATVYDTEGVAVGTIQSVEDGQTVLDTGTYQFPLAVDMYAQTEQGPAITVTRAQLIEILGAQAAERNAARDAALTSGASVTTSDGQMIGTIASIDGDNIVIEYETGPISLARNLFRAGDTGPVLRYTNAQFESFVTDGEDAEMAVQTPASEGDM